MLRRLHALQPAAFAFTPANLAWAQAQMTKYPEGRQASAIIPLLWRAQEQEGWLSRPAIEYVSNLLGLAYIRGLEVATFYFMFQLQPVGSVAHVQVCGTTSCMIMGAEDLVEVCKARIARSAHALSADGRFSWEEVECLGACSNAPAVQIGKDYYEDLTPARLEAILDELAAGKVPVPGPQNGRYAAEPLSGLTSLTDFESGRRQYNYSAQAAVDLKDTVKRIDGSEVALTAPWLGRAQNHPAADVTPATGVPVEPLPGKDKPADATGVLKQEAQAISTGSPKASSPGTPAAPLTMTQPQGLAAARDNKPDDLKLIKGVGPKLEALLQRLGYYHFDQLAAWTETEVAWVDDNLEGFKGRVTREGWVVQARVLATGAETRFSTRKKKGKTD